MFRSVCGALIMSATALWAESEAWPVSDPPSFIKTENAGSEAEQDAIDRVLELCAALRIDEITQVLQSEGQGYGSELDRDMLDGRGGAYWAAMVEDIYGAKRMADKVSMALLAEMTPQQINKSLAFLRSDTGRTIVSLELSARKALRDPDLEDAARGYYESVRDGDDPRLAMIDSYVEANNLVEQNVAGAMSFSYFLYRGMVDGGALEMDEDGILAEIRYDEPETRLETEAWLYAFLLTAYRPLSDQDLEANLTFSQSDAGQALNLALFKGFEMAYRDISYDLGVGLAGAMASRDL
ncbi:hypothetical protein LCL97_21085 [Seohaeicola saemankumensis]|nr:hypothetical protein [Seohaeicola saemankumensis]MCA0873333.1 hypothetical protein [Seohaeicola saemankumensis]